MGCGFSAEESIHKFQTFLNLDEQQLDTDALKSSFYRNQKRFRHAMREDRDNFSVDVEPLVTRDDLKEMMREVMDEFVVSNPVLIVDTPRRRKLSKKHIEIEKERQMRIKFSNEEKIAV